MKYLKRLLMTLPLLILVLTATTIDHLNDAHGETKTNNEHQDAAARRYIAVIRAGEIQRIDPNADSQRDLSQGPPALVIIAASISHVDDTLRATDCHVIVSARQTTLQGEAAEIQFDSKTHIAILTDAVLRTSVAVIGEDLEDLTTLQAKAMTIDMRSFQIKAEAATTVVDFSIRESSVLDGEWDVVAMQGDGVAATSTELKTQRWSVAGNEITGLAHGTSGKMSFTLDTAHTPHQINITPPDGNGKGITIAGIFEMTGQRLRICLAEQGHDRPMEFRAGPESWTIELKRIAETTVERK